MPDFGGIEAVRIELVTTVAVGGCRPGVSAATDRVGSRSLAVSLFCRSLLSVHGLSGFGESDQPSVTEKANNLGLLNCILVSGH